MIKKILLIFILLFSFQFCFAETNPCLLSDWESKAKCEKQMYLSENISEIASNNGAEEVLGGTFYIVSMKWIDNNTAIVEFEDGHNLFSAKVVFKNGVGIDSFDLEYDNDSIGIEVTNDSIKLDDKKGNIMDFLRVSIDNIWNFFQNLFN